MKGLLNDFRARSLLAPAGLLTAIVSLIVVLQFLNPTDITNPAPDKDQVPVVVFPDFTSIQSVELKKQQFLDYLQGFIVAENFGITTLRKELKSYADISNSGFTFSPTEKQWVSDLADIYRIKLEQFNSDNDIINELMLRVDVIPVSLALAQAANESAWGTSRFALEGNNVFGQWCYKEGCGMVPAERRKGATHEVKSFQSVESSVKAYFLNINSHPSYRYLREVRAGMRQRQGELDPVRLAYGLDRYSERGDIYVDELQNLIIQNNLLLRDDG